MSLISIKKAVKIIRPQSLSGNALSLRDITVIFQNDQSKRNGRSSWPICKLECHKWKMR